MEAARELHRDLTTLRGVQDELLSLCQESLELHDGAVIFEAKVQPELAKAILVKLNERNIRTKDPNTVRQYVESMVADLWHRNFDCIVFTGDDLDLENGQHRLQAVVNSGIPQTFIVVIYAPTLTAKGQDTGKKRQIYTTHGISLVNAAAARVLRCLITGQYHCSRDAVEQACQEYPELNEFAAILRVRRPTRQGHVAAAFAISAHHLAGEERQSVYELARDIVEIGGQFIISPVITKCLEDAKPVALTERCDESLKLLRGIDAHLKGESVQILRPSTASLRRFLPTAKYRSVHPSPQLRRSAR